MASRTAVTARICASLDRAGAVAVYGRPHTPSPVRVSQTHGRPGPSRADSAYRSRRQRSANPPARCSGTPSSVASWSSWMPYISPTNTSPAMSRSPSWPGTAGGVGAGAPGAWAEGAEAAGAPRRGITCLLHHAGQHAVKAGAGGRGEAEYDAGTADHIAGHEIPGCVAAEVVGEDAPRSLARRSGVRTRRAADPFRPPGAMPAYRVGGGRDTWCAREPALGKSARGAGVAARRTQLAGTCRHGGGHRVRAVRLEQAPLRDDRGGEPGLRRRSLQLHAGARHVLRGDGRERGHHDPREQAARGDDGGRRGRVPRLSGGRAGPAARRAVGRRTRAVPVRGRGRPGPLAARDRVSRLLALAGSWRPWHGGLGTAGTGVLVRLRRSAYHGCDGPLRITARPPSCGCGGRPPRRRHDA